MTDETPHDRRAVERRGDDQNLGGHVRQLAHEVSQFDLRVATLEYEWEEFKKERKREARDKRERERQGDAALSRTEKRVAIATALLVVMLQAAQLLQNAVK